jgi:hypothetical protein
MSFADDFAELLVDAVDWRPVVSRNRFGEPTYGAVVRLPAMVEHVTRIIRTPRGEEVTTRGEARVSGIHAIGPDDEVVLRCPSLPSLDGASPVVLDVRPRRDYDRVPYMTTVIF